LHYFKNTKIINKPKIAKDGIKWDIKINEMSNPFAFSYLLLEL
jgi:hypothetical protein